MGGHYIGSRILKDMDAITSKEQFDEARRALEEITEEMTRLGGFELLSDERRKEYGLIARAIYEWERMYHPLPGRTSTLMTDTVQDRIREMRLKQKEAACLLGISESRMSDFLNGKRKITISFAKKLRDKLHIPADFILDNV